MRIWPWGKGEKSRWACFLREKGGLGDLVCIFPAIKRYKEMGYTTMLYAPKGYADIVHAFGQVDEFFPTRTNTTVMDHSPNRREDYVESIFHDAGRPVPENRLVFNMLCPAAAIERAAAKYRSLPPVNRMEMFWVAAGLYLDDMPQDPMNGILKAPQPPELPLCVTPGVGYALVQAHAEEQEWRYLPPEQVYEKMHWAIRDGIHSDIIVTGTDAQRVDWWRRHLPNSDMVIKPNYRMLLSLIAHADRVYGPDSAFCHLSAALGVPFTGWFGITDGHLTCRRYPLAEYIQSECPLRCYYEKTVMLRECASKGRCLTRWS